jgi:hypothetical protein
VDLLRIPGFEARLSRGGEGPLIRRYLGRRIKGTLRMASIEVCHLAVPADPAEYSAGSHLQTLRRKVRAAEKAGVTWRRVVDRAEQVVAALPVPLTATRPPERDHPNAAIS